MVKLKKHSLGIVFVVAFSVFLCRNLFLSPGFVEGNDTLGWIARTGWFSNNNDLFYIWSNWAFGLVQPSSLHIPLTMLNFLVHDPTLVVKIFIQVTVLFAGLSMYFFVYHYTKKRVTGLIATYLFLLSQFFVTRLTSGHLYHFLGFAMAPLIFYTFDRAIISGKFKSITFFSIVVSVVIAFTRLDLMYYYAPFLALFFLFSLAFLPEGMKKRALLGNLAKLAVIGIPMILLFTAFQFFPMLFGVRPEYISTQLTMPWEELKWWSLEFYESFLVLAREIGVQGWKGGIAWDKHPFLSLWQYRLAMSVVPVLAFSALFLRREKWTLFLAISALIAVFLAKGPSEPFEGVFLWLYQNVPFFNLVKTPNRWVMIAVFSYTFLAAITLNATYIKLWQFRESLTRTAKGYRKWLGRLFTPVPLMLVISIMVVPSFGSWYMISPGLGTWEPAEQEVKPHLWLAQEQGDFRVATVPYFQTYMYNEGFWSNSLESQSGGLWSGKPVVWTGGWKIGLSYDFTAYTHQLVLENETDDLMKILGTFDVKYLVIQGYLPTEMESLPIGYDENLQSDFFKKQKGLKEVYAFGDAVVYENEFWTPRFFSPSDYVLIVGGKEAYTKLLPLAGFEYNKYAMLFANQIIDEMGEKQFLKLLEKAKALIFLNSEPLDLAFLNPPMDAIRIRSSEFPLSSNPWGVSKYYTIGREKWTGSKEWIRKGMFVLNNQTLSTAGTDLISKSFGVKAEGRYDIWVKILYGPGVGTLTITIDDKPIGEITPYTPEYSGMRWVKIGSTELKEGAYTITLQNHVRKIDSFPGSMDIDEVMIVKPESLNSRMDELTKMLSNNPKSIMHIIEGDEALKWSANPKETITSAIPKDICNDNQTAFWTNFNPDYVQLEDDTEIKIAEDSQNSLKVSITPGREYFTLLDKRYKSFQDWSQVNYFSLWFKGNNTGSTFAFAVVFNGSYENYVRFGIQDNSSQWRRLIFPRYNPDSSRGTIDWSRVSAVRFQGDDKNFLSEFHLDHLTRLHIESEAGSSAKQELSYSVLRNANYALSLRALTGPGYGTLDVLVDDESQYSVDFDRSLEVNATVIINNDQTGWDSNRPVLLRDTNVIINDNQRAFWTNLNSDYVQLENDSEVKIAEDSQNSLKFDIIDPDRKYATLLEKNYETFQDWSQDEYFSLWFKGNNTDSGFAFGVYFNDSYEDCVRWGIKDSSSEWTRHVFSKSNPDYVCGTVDWSKVWRVTFIGHDKNLTDEFHLDQIERAQDIEREPEWEWFTGQSMFLQAGDHTIKLQSEGKVNFDQVVLYVLPEGESVEYTELLSAEGNEAKVTSYQKINPTKYEVRVNTDKPFFLMFSESYHAMWKAFVDGEEIDPIPSYSFINGFYLTKTGEYDVTIEFTGQRYLYYGGIISIASLLIAIAFAVLDWRGYLPFSRRSRICKEADSRQ